MGQHSSKSKNKPESIDTPTDPILKSTDLDIKVAPAMPHTVNPESAEDGSDVLRCSSSEVSKKNS